MKREEIIGKRIVKVMDSIVNFTVLVILLLLLVIGMYAMWDSNQVYQAASSSAYEMYKPTPDGSLSFEELQALNSDVIAWLEIYGTTIDYPIVQGEDNDKYLNTDVLGRYSLSGSLFLDYQNARDFSDYNSIIFGHHMDKAVMFGGIDKFLDATYFEEYRYGNLFFDGKDRGVEFFAFIEADAYDATIYRVAVPEDIKESYLDNLLEKATHVRNVALSTNENIVLLSTCTSDSTNGRHILVGRITDEVYPNTFTEEQEVNTGTGADERLGLFERIPGIVCIIFGILLLFLIILCYRNLYKKRNENKNKSKRQKNEIRQKNKIKQTSVDITERKSNKRQKRNKRQKSGRRKTHEKKQKKKMH